MLTKDIDSLTNSVMMKFENVMRKSGVAAEFHPHYVGNRALVRGMIAMMLPHEGATAIGFHPHYTGNRALIRGMIAMMLPEIDVTVLDTHTNAVMQEFERVMMKNGVAF
jgi:hypothetical protein